MNDLKQIIASNISRLRKQKNLTQLEFAKALNYSDKAISKWERSESIPDIVILKQIADLFGVTVDYIINEHPDNEKILVVEKKKKTKINKISLTLLATCPIWIIATIVFTFVLMFANIYLWQAFVVGVPFSLLIFLIFNSIWGNRRNNYFIVSCFVWSILLCFYLCFIKFNIWQLFILGIPAQISIILWSTLKRRN